ncbi:MAG: DUF4202 domain-containing protein [Cyclobacteriaceae bacterium]
MTDKLKHIFEKIDEVNSSDPNIELVSGAATPKELIYGLRMSEVLMTNFESPSELLQIAARGQHIKRWSIPRSDFPMDRKGYLKWRTTLKIFHGDLVGELMQKSGYNKEEISYVKDLLMKKSLKTNPDTQTLEDTICLVFLKYYIDEFAVEKEENKLISIIQKTWGKMSDRGHELALQINFHPDTKSLIGKALNP